MAFKDIKNSSKYYWTEHVKFKMQFYGLSEQRIARVIRNPKRQEEGIVEKTIAVMQPVSIKKIDGKDVWKQEIWVMYQGKVKSSIRQPAEKVKSGGCDIKNLLKPSQLKIISAWRYPGVSPERDPIPMEILQELENID